MFGQLYLAMVNQICSTAVSFALKSEVDMLRCGCIKGPGL